MKTPLSHADVAREALSGLLAGLLVLFLAIAALGCATAPPAPLPQPQPAPRVIVDRVPVYDPCPPPAYLPRPQLWPLLVDGIQSTDPNVKLTVLEQVGQSWQWYADDLSGQLDVYRLAPPAPRITPTPDAAATPAPPHAP